MQPKRAFLIGFFINRKAGKVYLFYTLPAHLYIQGHLIFSQFRENFIVHSSIHVPRRMALYTAYDACIESFNSNLCLFFVVSVPLKEK